MKDTNQQRKWRKVGNNPVKVSSSSIYLGIVEKLNGDEIMVKLAEILSLMSRDKIMEWLSCYRSVKSNLKVRRISMVVQIEPPLKLLWN